jgi:uncharacterized protein
LTYIESSAVVKLVAGEPGRDELRQALAAWPERASSLLTLVEARRALARDRPPEEFEPVLAQVTEPIDLIPISRAIVESASRLQPRLLRSLDAIHLASALSLGADLDALVTYDRRLAEAARGMGLRVFP